MGCLQQCGAKDDLEVIKVATIKHLKSWSTLEEGDAVCCGGIAISSVRSPQNQTLNSDKYFSKLKRLKAEIDKNPTEFINPNRFIFHKDNVRPRVSADPKEFGSACLDYLTSSRRTQLILHFRISIHFQPYKVNSRNGKKPTSLEAL